MDKLPSGLTSQEASARLKQSGPNALRQEQPKSVVHLALSQTASPLILILVAAATITFFLHDISDTLVIILAILVNTILGFIQEYKADRALYALKKLLQPQAKVIRDGVQKLIPASEIVCGDTLLLAAGDRVPADGVAISVVKLFVNEAVLTGESMAVEKTSDFRHQTSDGKDKTNLFMGTMVASGRGMMRVMGTGMETDIGQIARELTKTKEEDTPLQRQLSRLARFISLVVLGVSFVVFVFGIAAGESARDMFSTAVAVAVAAIPEGMVVALTVVLAMGMQRIYKKNAIVRRLSAAETLGSVSVICVDKTGTITQGTMQVVKTKFTDTALALQAAALANNREDPLEVALWEWLKKEPDIDLSKLTAQAKRHDEIPFGGEHKYMAVKTDTGLWVKGAPDILLRHSDLTQSQRDGWTGEIETYGREGLRVIALCYKYTPDTTLTKSSMRGLTFVGIIGISDPVRQGVSEAIRTCQTAGIAVKMVTGDYRHTAEAVLGTIGLPITNHAIGEMDGETLEKLTSAELAKLVEDIVLFYRVTPQQKYKIVEALQMNGHTVAMTGDGVNDALAIKKADIGLVVAGASDVARETADIVLLDSNIGTIAAVIEEGRAMFHTIRKVVVYLLSGAFAEVVAILAAIASGIPLPITAAQILWINLIADGIPSIALTLDPKDTHLMRERPRRYTGGLVTRPLVWFILIVSTFVGLLTAAIFIVAYRSSGDIRYSRTLAFLVLATCSLFIGFSVRNLHAPIWREGLWRNPWLFFAITMGMLLTAGVIYAPGAREVFQTTPVSLAEWAIAFTSGILVVVGIELAKLIHRLHIRT